MLILALADAHIPDRAIDLPSKFQKLLNVPNKISKVILLGNCTKSYSFLKFVQSITPNIVPVRGEFDNGKIILPSKDTGSINHSKQSQEIPMTAVFEQGGFRIGCCSGYTIVPKSDPLSLLALARQLDVDIMLWGGTHNVEAYTLEGKFFVNPGSCTGAFNTDWPIPNDFESEFIDIPEAPKEEIKKEAKDNITDNTDNEVTNKDSELDNKQDVVKLDSSEEKNTVTKAAKDITNEYTETNLRSEKSFTVDTESTSDVDQKINRKEQDTSKEIEDTSQDFDQNQKEELEKEPKMKSDSEQDEKEDEITQEVKDNKQPITKSSFQISEFDVNGASSPSFVLLDIQASVCTLYVYMLLDGEVKVDKVVYKKDA
ncbi:hypothetical protein TBLA_0E02730 [Henningerozyma blattae CBS 6284]|uniref:Vacuolar protein sorting-associated protein 29 n=1 Tax=Henningerozyma blattae (strain ATCC 34711 / CBS 6284 / DSM 70876 / NBRC 10599 / NRRL Y-10934 / UCD 77-7) TaxID=1071380 RepID=I2H4M7_HENB6|nr:hypothetical protein TBLA_0E02730 [Tetrapisispora blattae CBS 6284]CCH61329.1 hypothetical protein TBLA_0E02730 [Tetrapisispora blattae CBS 6284]